MEKLRFSHDFTDNTYRGIFMKKIFQNVLYLSLIMILMGCSPEQKSESTGSSNDSGQDFGNGDGGTGSGSGSGGGSSSSNNNCTGTTSDGTGDGTPIHQFNLFLAGHQTWVPGDYDFNNELISQTMITPQEASILFSSDSKLKIRFKINSQPFPTAGQEYCYGRNTGSSSDQYTYTKLRFRVSLRDILCDQPNASNPTQCDSGFYLGNPYRAQYISPVNVDSCSNIIDIGSIRNASIYGTTVQVDDVKADSACQVGGTNEVYCPAEKIVRAASCWHMTMQVSTDYTQSFK